MRTPNIGEHTRKFTMSCDRMKKEIRTEIEENAAKRMDPMGIQDDEECEDEGIEDTILELRFNADEWTELPQKLNQIRSDHVVIPIDDPNDPIDIGKGIYLFST